MWGRPAYSIVEYRKSIGKSVEAGHWHYAEWDSGAAGSMLYDLSQDPHELKNLANDPKYAKTVAEMKRLLAKMP
jgi:arylsulfatase A-like enzyme